MLHRIVVVLVIVAENFIAKRHSGSATAGRSAAVDVMMVAGTSRTEAPEGDGSA